MTSTACPRLRREPKRTLKPADDLSTIKQGILLGHDAKSMTTLARVLATTRFERRTPWASNVDITFLSGGMNGPRCYYAQPMSRKPDCYAEALMKEWGLDEQPARFRREVKQVLMELCAETQLVLKSELRLQVEIVAGGPVEVWAYFPRARAKAVCPMLRSQAFDPRPPRAGLANVPRTGARCLRHHLGHALLYQREPRARNECADAVREWKECCRPEGVG